MRKILTTVILLGIVIGAVSVIFKLKLPHDTFLWRELQNTGHTLLFGVVAMAFLGISTAIFPGLASKRPYHYLIAFLAASFIGGAVEIAQIWLAGDPDLGDFLRDIAGALSFLGFCMFFDRKLFITPAKDKWQKLTVVSVTFIVLAMALVPISSLAWSYYNRNLIFPHLVNFESDWEANFIKTRNVQFTRTPAPEGWPQAKSRLVADVTFMPSNYPTLYIEEPYSNWVRYKHLCFDIYSQQDTSLKLTLTVEDFHHNNSFDDRFNYSFIARPGHNSILIPLENIKNAPAKRKMDMKAIQAIHLFAHKPAKAFNVYLDNFRLE